nr:centrosomal protein of 128 kDa-like isoform X2 [Odocoileus virginianus texanus]
MKKWNLCSQSYYLKCHLWKMLVRLQWKIRKKLNLKKKQDRVNALETSTRVALDHLESVPEKLSLLEDFKGFRGSRSLSDRIDERYSKYRVHRESLQQCRDDPKHRIQSFKDDRNFAESSHAHGLNQSSCWQDHSRFLSSPRFSHLNCLFDV